MRIDENIYTGFRDGGVLNENSLSTSPYRTSSGDYRYMWGIEYNIIPLSRNLDMKGNDRKTTRNYQRMFRDDFYPGQEVTGICTTDNEVHRGKIVSFLYSHRHPELVQFFVILDCKTQTMLKLLPNTVEHYDESKKKRNLELQLLRDRFDDNISRLNIEIERIKQDNMSESVVVEDESEEMLDMSPEDLMYRDELLERFPLHESTIRYLDEKFSGSHFEDSYLRMTKMPFDVLKPLIGAPNHNRAQNYVTDVVNMYCAMTNQHYSLTYSDGYMNIDFNIPTQRFDIRVRSWREMYMLIEAILRIYRRIRHTVDYTPAEDNYAANWNSDTKNPKYINQMSLFVTKFCQTQFPETVILSDGSKKKIFNLNAI
jgi:hypothetical protein